MGSSKASKPAAPPPPEPPVTQEDPNVKSASEAVRRRLRAKGGRAGTLIADESRFGGKTLLGE